MVHPHVLQTPSGPMQPAVFVVRNNYSARRVEVGVKGERLPRGGMVVLAIGSRSSILGSGQVLAKFFFDHFCVVSSFPFWYGHHFFVW